MILVLRVSALLCPYLCVAVLQGAAPESSPRRAKPPVWSEDEQELFPGDARDLLVGPRPNFSALAEKAPTAAGTTPSEPAASYRWSALIGPETIETEIKRQASRISGLVQSATAFKGGGYRECRDAFSMLAVMFAIAAEHDGDARWRDKAEGLSALFARAGANCKVGTDGSFREAAARSEDLAELVRGGRPDVPKPPSDKDWGKVADRSPIMRRMELAQQERLSPLMSDDRSFSRGAEDALHEAQVLAALAEVLTREGQADSGDETYDGYAHSLRDAAGDLSRGADQENYELARQAAGRIGQACSVCHEDYRG